jgi:hypothetical protein
VSAATNRPETSAIPPSGEGGLGASADRTPAEGLRFSRETLFFEPGNVLLMNTMREMIADLVAGKDIGVPDWI